MRAAHAGRLCTVQYLVRHCAVVNYEKGSRWISAIAIARPHSRVVRWSLVGRFIDQRRLTAAENQDGDAKSIRKTANEHVFVEGDLMGLDFVFSEDARDYFEQQDRLQKQRRFVDDGDGSFVKIRVIHAESFDQLECTTSSDSVRRTF